MKITFEEYNKKMEKLMKSKKFSKLHISDQLIAMLDLSNKYEIETTNSHKTKNDEKMD